MRRSGFVLVLAVAGVLLAASIGYAAYLASRDSVGLPVTKLQPSPRGLAPRTPRTRQRSRGTTTVETHATATTDDRSGRSPGRSGHGGGGGHGGDD